MQEVNEEDEQDVKFYIPHLSIYRPEKNTIKLRVAFNASVSSSNGTSLNSLQSKGDAFHHDLFSTMSRFRKRVIDLTAHVQKIYRIIIIYTP